MIEYIILDGYLIGTGVRNKMTSEFIKIDKLNLSNRLKLEIQSWCSQYHLSTIENLGHNENIFYQLDLKGIELSKSIIKENKSYKIDYYYSDFFGKMIFQNEW